MAITINHSQIHSEVLFHKSFVSENLREQIMKAGIIIMPFERYEKLTYPVFPQGTECLLRYFKKHLHKQEIEICIEDHDYVEMSFSTSHVQLGKFFLRQGASKAFAGVLGAYVFDHFVLVENFKPKIKIVQAHDDYDLGKEPNLSVLTEKKYLENKQVQFSVDLQMRQNQMLHMEYQGPAKNLDTVLIKLMEYE